MQQGERLKLLLRVMDSFWYSNVLNGTVGDASAGSVFVLYNC